MKKIANILIIIVLSICSIPLFQVSAQISDENTLAINRYFQQANLESNTVNSSAESNNVGLEETRYLNSNVAIVQYGNFNKLNVKTSGGTIGVKQVGDYNSYDFLSYYGRNDLNVQVEQLGNSNHIEIFGENSLMDNLKVVQKSSFKTITITNY